MGAIRRWGPSGHGGQQDMGASRTWGHQQLGPSGDGGHQDMGVIRREGLSGASGPYCLVANNIMVLRRLDLAIG